MLVEYSSESRLFRENGIVDEQRTVSTGARSVRFQSRGLDARRYHFHATAERLQYRADIDDAGSTWKAHPQECRGRDRVRIDRYPVYSVLYDTFRAYLRRMHHDDHHFCPEYMAVVEQDAN